MSVVYLHTNTSSALVGDPSEVGNYLMQREAGSTGPNINSGNMNQNITRSLWFFSEVGDPGTFGAAGNFTVQLMFNTQNANIRVQCYLQRYNSAGVAQGTAVQAAQTTQTAGAATRTYTWTTPGLGTWASGDRLGLRVQFTNTSTSMNQSCVLQVNDAGAYTQTPFTQPATVESLVASTLTVDVTLGAELQEVSSNWGSITEFTTTNDFYTDSTVEAGKTYRYSVASTDGTNNSAYTSWVEITLSGGAAPVEDLVASSLTVEVTLGSDVTAVTPQVLSLEATLLDVEVTISADVTSVTPGVDDLTAEQLDVEVTLEAELATVEAQVFDVEADSLPVEVTLSAELSAVVPGVGDLTASQLEVQVNLDPSEIQSVTPTTYDIEASVVQIDLTISASLEYVIIPLQTPTNFTVDEITSYAFLEWLGVNDEYLIQREKLV